MERKEKTTSMNENKTFTEYNEILCEAVNNLIDARLQAVKFDETIVCTIVDNGEKDNGKYTVTNGSLTFEATSDVTSYMNNEQVYVLIPQGDYSAQKTIVCRYKNSDEAIKAFAGANTTIVHYHYTGFKLDGHEVSIPVKNINKVILSGEFYNPESVEDRYGLVAELYLNNSTEKYIPVLLDSHTNMFGNPKEFVWFSKQSVTDDLIAYADQDAIITKIVITRFDDIIKIRNVSLDLCYDISTADGLARLEIQSSSYAGYSSSEPKRDFVALYFDGSKGEKLNNVQWQKKKDNQWINIDTIEFDSGARATSIRAVYTDSEIEIISNVLTFENLEQLNNNHEAFFITLGENSMLHYPVYNDNYQIVQNQRYKERHINIQLKDYYDEKLIGDAITWYVPKNSTMLRAGVNDDWVLDNESDNNYYIYSYSKNEDIGFPDFIYELNETYNTNWVNNTLKCKLKYNNTDNILYQSFTFTHQGNSGTYYTLIVTPEEGYRGWTVNEHNLNKPLIYHAILYDPDGNDITEDYTFTWSYEDNITDKNLYEGSTDTNFSNRFIITGRTENLSTTEAKLTVTVIVNRITLTKTIPILYMQNQNCVCEVPTIANYDLNGNLIDSKVSYNTNIDNQKCFLRIYERSNPKSFKDIESNTDLKNIVDGDFYTWKQYFPLIENSQFSFAPRCGTDFVKKYGMVLQCLKDNVLYYEQPILIMHDRYASTIINEWDGQLKIDEDGNRIMTALIVAGEKNTNNEFSGVLVGDIDALGESTLQGEGIVGMQAGMETFRLDTTGQVTIGTAEKGQIKINGNGGIIESGNNTGMSINLLEGKIIAKQFALTANNLELTNTSFKIGSEGTDENGNKTKFISYDEENGVQAFLGDVKLEGEEFNLNFTSNGKTIKLSNEKFYIGSDTEYIKYDLNDGLDMSATAKKINLNANNFIINTAATDDSTMFQLGADGADTQIKYTAKGTLSLKIPTADIVAEKLNIKSNNFIINTDTATIPYFQIGASSSNHIIYKKDGTLDINLDNIAINTNTFTLNADTGNKLYLTNSGVNSKPQFKVGTTDEYINFENDKLDIQVNDLRIAPNNTNAIVGAQNGFTPWICNPGTLEYPKVSDVTWDADKNAYKLTVYKQSDKIYGGMLIAYDCSHLVGKGSFNLSGNFYLRYQHNSPWSDVAVCFGYKNTYNLYDENTPFINTDLLKEEISGGNHQQYSTGNLENNILNWNGDTAFAYNNINFPSDAPYLIFLVQCIHPTEKEQGGVSYSTPFEFYIKDLQLVKSDGTAIDLTDDRLNSVYDRLTHLSPSYSDGIFMSNGHLAINASAISTGILSSANGNLQWNLNDGVMMLAPEAPFITNNNFTIGAQGLTFETSQNLQSQLTNSAFVYYTPNYQATTTESSGPGYYYKIQKTNNFNTRLFIRDASTGLQLEGIYLESETDYKIVCDSDGNFLDPQTKQPVISGHKYYWLKLDDKPGDFMISRVYNNKNIFSDYSSENTNAVRQGGPISATAYTGNKLILSDVEESTLIFSSEDGAKGIKITGSGITTWGEYSTPF